MVKQDWAHYSLTETKSVDAINLVPVLNGQVDNLLPGHKAWLSQVGFRGHAGEIIQRPDKDGKTGTVYVGVDTLDSRWAMADLPKKLPAGTYNIDQRHMTSGQADKIAIGWALGSYDFDKYRSGKNPRNVILQLPENCDVKKVKNEIEATCMVRDLINEPANVQTPAELFKTVNSLAKTFNAKAQNVTSISKLKKDFPLVHAVGKGSGESKEMQPCVADFTWGNPDHPKVTLVGKGISFDTGGHNLKPGAFMRDMKRDMGGAAMTLGLAYMIMSSNLPVRLRTIIPIASNDVSGEAMRPGDIYKARNGLSVEIGNTDAEGRLILADGLSAGMEEKPDMIMSIAGLTGAAPNAAGPKTATVFSTDEPLSFKLISHGREGDDPVWPIPFSEEIKPLMKSDVADLVNSPASGEAGHVQAAWFLHAFAGTDKDVDWVHLDGRQWNNTPSKGRPAGGEARGMRALYNMVKERYAGPKIAP